MLVLLLLGTSMVARAQTGVTCNINDRRQDLTATFEQQGTTRIVALKGGIVRGSSGVVARALDSGRPYDQVWLCSGGGLVAEGIAIGKIFSRRKAWVRVPAGFMCASSCTIMTLGGYLRTIDEGASFIVHAPSSVKELGTQDLSVDNCMDSSARESCLAMAAALVSSSLRRCDRVSQFEDAADPCVYVVDGVIEAPRIYGIKGAWFRKNTIDKNLLAIFARVRVEKEVLSALELLKYYQQMLNDGNEAALNTNAYSMLARSNADIPDIYQSGVRNLTQDAAAISMASPDNRPVVWQELITQYELYSARNVSRTLESHAGELGRGGKAALKLLDAMTRCRIQSTCFLDANTMAELGYANFEIK